MYTVELSTKLKVRQGLPSPERRKRGLGPAQPEDGFDTILRVGIQFEDSQLTEQGWFVDTDSVEHILEKEAEFLASIPWTELFSDFRPTYENVAKEVFARLQKQIPQIAHVEFENRTISVVTRYSDKTIQ